MGNKNVKSPVSYENIVQNLPDFIKEDINNHFLTLSEESKEYNIKSHTNIAISEQFDNRIIPKDTFISNILKEKIKKDEILENVFAICDISNNGFINYIDFFVSIYFFDHSSPEEKHLFYFNLFSNFNESISEKDFTILISKIISDNIQYDNLIKLYSHLVFKEYKRKNSEKLDYTCWLRFSREDDFLNNLFSKTKEDFIHIGLTKPCD